ncbi:MAG: PEGA domain-containing protein, partial [Calditrichaeota bacterium]
MSFFNSKTGFDFRILLRKGIRERGSWGTWLIFIMVFMLLFSSLGFAQQKGTVEGRVTDAKTGEGLPGANVFLKGTFIGGSTDMDGHYEFEAPPGTYTVMVTFVGYATAEQKVTVTAGEKSTVDFQLSESIAEFGEVMVIVGSRAQRTAVETPVPVDVISEVEVRESPQVELNQVLRDLVPSYNASHQTISDGTDHINPASLRGLGPDQVLVLINGKRRHTSALVHVNGTFGRGTVGVDLNAIPKSSIERVEVLRDGAAAQYGSDAIAGVINIVLKQTTDRLRVNVSTGANNLLFKKDISLSDEIRNATGLSSVKYDDTDGETYTIDANYGFRIGDNGYFNIAAEYIDRGRTNRSTTWTGKIFNDSDTPDTTFRDGKTWIFL